MGGLNDLSSKEYLHISFSWTKSVNSQINWEYSIWGIISIKKDNEQSFTKNIFKGFITYGCLLFHYFNRHTLGPWWRTITFFEALLLICEQFFLTMDGVYFWSFLFVKIYYSWTRKIYPISLSNYGISLNKHPCSNKSPLANEIPPPRQ